jgi:hypothetical protein
MAGCATNRGELAPDGVRVDLRDFRGQRPQRGDDRGLAVAVNPFPRPR